jgi:lipopolysaccharide transport system permease protein
VFFQVPITLQSFLFFPAIFLLIMMGMAIGLLILPVAMLYKDIQFVLPTFLQFAMYLTPVVYATPVFSGAAKILNLNPVSPVLTSGRDWLLGLNPDTDWGQLGFITFAVVVVLTAGIILQRIAIEILIERMGT